MHNELLTIGPFTVYGYGLMIAIGILAAYFLAEHLAKRRGLNVDHIFGLVIYAVVFGLAGAKILYIITRIPDLAADETILRDLANGWVIYGGILGGIVGILVASHIYKEKFLDYLDVAVPAVALAQGFGRIGCFLAGCCYGIEYDGIFSITFHTSEFAPNDVALFPTQLLSSGLNFLHFILLYLVFRRAKRRGIVVGTYLACYSIGRFILEYFRGDLVRGTVGLFSTSQFIAIFVGAAGIILLLYSAKRGSVIEFADAGTRGTDAREDAAAEKATAAGSKEPDTREDAAEETARPEDTEAASDDPECSEDQ